MDRTTLWRNVIIYDKPTGVQTLAAEISSPGPRRALGYFGCWQMLSKKSFLADERNFLAAAAASHAL
jgi:hypothetical protein